MEKLNPSKEENISFLIDLLSEEELEIYQNWLDNEYTDNKVKEVIQYLKDRPNFAGRSNCEIRNIDVSDITGCEKSIVRYAVEIPEISIKIITCTNDKIIIKIKEDSDELFFEFFDDNYIVVEDEELLNLIKQLK
jgi:hypothetical protein